VSSPLAPGDSVTLSSPTTSVTHRYAMGVLFSLALRATMHAPSKPAQPEVRTIQQGEVSRRY
jgi:hypothetical protein